MADELLLADRSFPTRIGDRLRRQLTFLVEIDKLKTIVRQSPLAAADRRENDAEHSWHLAMMVVVLAEYADEPIDVGRAVELVLIHDLIEIYAGDTPVFDPVGTSGQAERERAAADRLFPLLPADQATRLRERWDEFEERTTPEARFAKAVDALEPMLLNWLAKGGTWHHDGVDADVVRDRKRLIGDASTELWSVGQAFIDDGERHGWLRPGAR